MKRHGRQVPCCTTPPEARTSGSNLFEVHEVAEGVYAAIANSQYKVNSNAAVIVTEEGVVVVDSHSKPSAAAALRESIARITSQPISMVINTHFHWDHWQGNQAYNNGSGTAFVASEATYQRLLAPDGGVGGLHFVAHQIQELPQEIRELEQRLAGSNDPAMADAISANLAQARDYLRELSDFQPVLPTTRLTETTSIKLGDRQIDLILPGRSHTDGDVIVHLPLEEVLITGDVLIGWMPYMDDGYPLEWIATLEALEQLPHEWTIPGHGTILDRAHLHVFRSYLADLVDSVTERLESGEGPEVAARGIAGSLANRYRDVLSQYTHGRYDDRIESNIRTVYRSLTAD